MAARHKIISAGEHAKLGAFLRQTRERAGVSQRDLAKLLNLPQSYVSKIERGERQLQALEMIEVCRKIGVEPDAFIRDYISMEGASHLESTSGNELREG